MTAGGNFQVSIFLAIVCLAGLSLTLHGCSVDDSRATTLGDHQTADPDPDSDSDADLKFMSWNLMSWCTVRCESKRLKNIGQRLREYKPSVLCTQEHWDGGYEGIQNTLERETAGTGLTHRGYDTYYNSNDVEPVGELKRVEILGDPRFVSGQVYKHLSSGKHFAFFCTHWGFSDYDGQAQRTIDFINSVGDGNMPKLVLGDFNAMPWDHGVKKIETDLNYMDATADTGNTWCDNSKKIDFILHSLHWQKLNALTNREGARCGCDGGDSCTGYADHASLHAELRLGKGSGGNPTVPDTASPGACETASSSSWRRMNSCYTAASWAKNTGIHENPEWYPGLSSSSSTAEFQNLIHTQDDNQGCDKRAC